MSEHRLSQHATDSDAAELVRTVFKAVQYIHDCGIVHRGMFPHSHRSSSTQLDSHRLETREPDLPYEEGRRRHHDRRLWLEPYDGRRKVADADGNMWHTWCTCYGAHSHFSRHYSSDGDCSTWHPRSSRRVSDHFIFPCVWHLKCLFTAGHGKPVDIWAMGVITYFLLCGKVNHSILTACVLVNVYQDTLPSIATLNSKKWKQSSPAITNLSQACYDSRGPIFVS
jgi:calcium/calmodulin-dependent protein kinase I